MMVLRNGQLLLDRYIIQEQLGVGGFGAIYRALDTSLESVRAIKENLDTSLEAQQQFKREAHILGKLAHPNLPRVIDHFIIPDQGQYLVMDFIEGEDLQEILDRTGAPFSESQIKGWIDQICVALEYLHAQIPPIIHRDIKPANIKITPSGKAILVDFGIAKVYDSGVKTTVGARAVTPGYSPIEQYSSRGSTDERSDIYALGATIFTLLTWQKPPEAPERNIGTKLQSLSLTNPTISSPIEKAVLKAMEIQPERRFQSIVEFRQALQSTTFVNRTVRVNGSKPVQTPDITVSRRELKSWVYGISSIVIVLLLTILFYVIRSKPFGGTTQASSERLATIGLSSSVGIYQNTRISDPSEESILISTTTNILNPILPATNSENQIIPVITESTSKKYARISDQVPETNMRRTPGYRNKNAGDVVVIVPDGEIVEILSGPQNADGLQWWLVVWNGYQGWVADYTGSGKLILEFLP